MTHVSAVKRIYYAYLGRMYWFAFQSQWRQIGGFTVSSWLRFLSLVLFFAAFGWGWPLPVLLLTFLLMGWIWISYWRAGRAGYMRFVPDPAAINGETEPPGLADGERVNLYASGLYAVIDREESVLLRPSEYWRSAAGEHSVMVKNQSNKFLYQFFQTETLQAVEPGWLIFAKEPLSTLAVTFWQTWGPDHIEAASTYLIDNDESGNNKPKLKSRTIYFTFTDTAVAKQVLKKLTDDVSPDFSDND